jgi:hypothetical protein
VWGSTVSRKTDDEGVSERLSITGENDADQLSEDLCWSWGCQCFMRRMDDESS